MNAFEEGSLLRNTKDSTSSPRPLSPQGSGSVSEKEQCIRLLAKMLDVAECAVKAVPKSAHIAYKHYAEGVRDGLQSAYDAVCKL